MRIDNLKEQIVYDQEKSTVHYVYNKRDNLIVKLFNKKLDKAIESLNYIDSNTLYLKFLNYNEQKMWRLKHIIYQIATFETLISREDLQNIDLMIYTDLGEGEYYPPMQNSNLFLRNQCIAMKKANLENVQRQDGSIQFCEDIGCEIRTKVNNDGSIDYGCTAKLEDDGSMYR